MMEDLDDDFNNQGGVSGNEKGTYKDKPVTALPHPALAASNNATATTTNSSKPSSKMTLGKKPSSNSISVSINK